MIPRYWCRCTFTTCRILTLVRQTRRAYNISQNNLDFIIIESWLKQARKCQAIPHRRTTTNSCSMVASAVVVPEAVEQDISLSNNSALKRRQSSSAGIDTKRPRLSTDSQNYVKDDPRSPTSTATSPLRKGRGGKDEERARGKRLFGGLLGTLSQSSSSSAQKRRAEIEKKQQDKLRLQAEADDDEKRRKLEELTAARVVEQVKYDKQSVCCF